MLKLTLKTDECITIGDYIVWADEVADRAGGRKTVYSIIGPGTQNVGRSRRVLKSEARPRYFSVEGARHA